MSNDTPVSSTPDVAPAATDAAPEATPQETETVVSESKEQEAPSQTVTTKAATASKEAADKAVDAIEKAAKAGPNAEDLFEVKIDGKTVKVTRAELIAGYQKAKAAQKRFDEAAKMRKQSETLIKLLKEDPVAALSHPDIGHNVRELAERYLAEELKKEKMSPTERELEELKKKLAAIEAEKAAAQERAKQEEIAKMQEFYEQDYTNKILEALSSSGLPKNADTVSRMATYMLEAQKQGYELEPKDVVSLVKRDYMNAITALYSGLEGDDLINMIGPEIVNKIKKHEIAKVTSKTPAAPTQVKEVAKPAEPVTEEKPRKKLTWDEFIEKDLSKYTK